MSIYQRTITPVVTAGLYSANDVIGGRQQLVGVHAGLLESITISDLATQAVAYIVVFFSSVPTDIADNGTFDFADADLPNVLAVVALATTDRFAFTDNSVSHVRNLGVPLKSTEADGDIWFMVYSTGAPTYVGTSDVTFNVGILQ